MPQFTFTPQNPANIMSLVGVNDSNLKLLADGYDLTVADTGDGILIDSPDEKKVKLVIKVLAALEKVVNSGVSIAAPDVVSAMKMAEKGTVEFFGDLYNKILIRDAKGRPIRPKNAGQQAYIEAIQKTDIVFGIGPAGTGKTFLAVVMAVSAFKNGEVSRIILTRPAVEAGESLGFLPGDLKEKVDPYLRPIYDSLYAVLGTETTNRLMERGVIEVAPLAYMRGLFMYHCHIIEHEDAGMMANILIVDPTKPEPHYDLMDMETLTKAFAEEKGIPESEVFMPGMCTEGYMDHCHDDANSGASHH